MREKKLQIFVSSTYTDLIEERQAAVFSILSSGHIPAGMELFTAGDESQMTVIERWIDESDIYLLILGGRYGSIDPKTGKSYTQLEYEYAIKMGKPLFAVVISEKGLDAKVVSMGRLAMEQNDNQKLLAFRELVMTHLVRLWEDVKDIKIAITETLSEFSYRDDLKGWVRSDKVVNTGLLAEEIASLSKENQDLRNKLLEINPSSNLLYSGLTFDELYNELYKLTLTNNIIEGVTTIEALKAQGEKFIGYGIHATSIHSDLIQVLQKYALVEMSKINTSLYKFTNDGHKFYLRLLIS